MYIFDKTVVPILLYGAEVWGFKYYKILEEVQVNFCKNALGLPRNAANLAALGECGRYPLAVEAYVKCIKYWLKIQGMPTGRYPRSCYKLMKQMEESGYTTWASYVKNLLMKYGFGHVWLAHCVGDVKSFISVFRQRVQDCCQQDFLWKAIFILSSKMSSLKGRSL